MTLEVAYILKSSHVEHVDCPVIRTSYNFTLRQLESHVYCPGVILYSQMHTEAKEADLAIFLTPLGGILAKGYMRALGLMSFELPITAELPLLLWSVIKRGPA